MSEGKPITHLADSTKIFIVTVIFAAILQKLGEGIYDYFTKQSIANGDSTKSSLFWSNMGDFQLWQIVILIYFFITLIRHTAGALVTSPLSKEKNIRTQNPRYLYYSFIADQTLTLVLFVLHYMVAISISKNFADLQGNTTNVVIPTIIAVALFFDLILCVFWISATKLISPDKINLTNEEAQNIKELNKKWAWVSVIELLLMIITISFMDLGSTNLAALSIVISILIGVYDITFNAKEWSKII